METKKILYILLSLLTFKLNATEFTDPTLENKESVWTVFGKSFKLCRLDSQYVNDRGRQESFRVEFPEDGDKVSPMYQIGLENFGESLESNYEITMTAHADQCGGEEYNKNLAGRRLSNVEFELLKSLKNKVSIKRIVKGEDDSFSHGQHDRYVEIIAKVPLKGIVLIDNSRSFQGRNYSRSGIFWGNMSRIKFKNSSIIYVVTHPTMPCKEKLSEFKPYGEDLYKHAQYLLTTKMKGDFFVSTYTDGWDINDNEICEEYVRGPYRNRKYPRNATLAQRRALDKRAQRCRELKKEFRQQIKKYGWDKKVY